MLRYRSYLNLRFSQLVAAAGYFGVDVRPRSARSAFAGSRLRPLFIFVSVSGHFCHWSIQAGCVKTTMTSADWQPARGYNPPPGVEHGGNGCSGLWTRHYRQLMFCRTSFSIRTKGPVIQRDRSAVGRICQERCRRSAIFHPVNREMLPEHSRTSLRG